MRIFVAAIGSLYATVAAAGPTVSCKMQKQEVVIYDREKKTSTEIEDWTADCTIKVGDKVIFADALPLVHPATFQEAAGAVDEFRKHKAAEILKAYKEPK